MSGRARGFAPILDVGKAVNAAIKKAPKARKPWGPLPPKVRRAMQPTKAQRDDFAAKFCAAYSHVRYHIQPTGIGFEVWDVTSHEVVGTFETLRSARAFVEAQ